MTCNRTQLCGRLEGKQVLRHTPAGVPMIEFSIVHRSEQMEAGGRREVQCEVPAVATAALAHRVAAWPIGATVQATGFLSRRSRTRAALVLHVQAIELTEQR